eukprot:TRINITY_DN5549_c2_g1_i1.p1 TRINITY_DN5549_c2_g1~~TRINITY_DN5549_c2_g1_i1.p1  ORF type:complete len:712 (+),score=102.82 TRINITY_DN5549_c2_g1_i1:114-2138(+)
MFFVMPTWCLASRVTGSEKQQIKDTPTDQGDGAHLCSAAVVSEECLLLSGDPSIMNRDDLKQALASADASVNAFWDAVLPDSPAGAPVTCQKLCLSTVAFASERMALPPAIDTGCYISGNQVVCDLDLSVNALEGRLQMGRREVPDMVEPMSTHDRQVKEFQAISQQLADGDRPATHHRQDIEYGVLETAVRVANLFRIYPLPSFSFGAFGEAPPMLPAAEGINGSSFLEDASLSGCASICSRPQHCQQYPYACASCRMCTRKQPVQPASNTAACYNEANCASQCDLYPRHCRGCKSCQVRAGLGPRKTCNNYCLNAGYCSVYPYDCGGCSFCRPAATTTTTTRPRVSSRGHCDQSCEPALGSYSSKQLCSEFAAACGGCKFCSASAVNDPPASCENRCPGIIRSVGAQTACPAYPKECGGCSACASLPAQHRDWRVEVQQRSQEAQTYINTAIRKFRRKATKEQITRWFGPEAYTDDRTRSEVLRTLNSVERMLGNVHYVYPGKGCDFGVYAYVYPKGAPDDTDEDTMTADGKYIFYLCPLYVYSPPSVQVETLTHEGSHHATAFTDDVCMDEFYENGRVQPQLEVLTRHEAPANVRVGDYLSMRGKNGEEIIIVVRFVTQSEVIYQMDPPMGNCKNKAYGRDPCQKLAKGLSWKALRNADNFCYYVQDITDA